MANKGHFEKVTPIGRQKKKCNKRAPEESY